MKIIFENEKEKECLEHILSDWISYCVEDPLGCQPACRDESSPGCTACVKKYVREQLDENRLDFDFFGGEDYLIDTDIRDNKDSCYRALEQFTSVINVSKLHGRLWDVPGAYAAFVAGVIRYASTAEYRRDKVLEYLNANPDATTSNIVKFVMEQDDFHEAAESTMKNKMISEADDVFIPEVVEVTPLDNYVVEVLFQDGKAVSYDVSHLLDEGAFSALKDTEFYRSRCTVMNHTLAWDLTGEGDLARCLDIDPYIIYYGEK